MTGHEVEAAVVGAGTGRTTYRASCSCGWTLEHASPSRVLDAAGGHELGLS